VKREWVAFACGVVFSMGLGVAGMTDPRKVIGFLDFLGSWDPSLLLVMAGAVAVYAVGYRVAMRAGRPILEAHFHIARGKRVEPRVLVGALVFGAGWGVSGYCPGPAVTSMASGAAPAMVFVVAMVAGTAIVDRVVRSRSLGVRQRDRHGDATR
jgi:uncharacterized protein